MGALLVRSVKYVETFDLEMLLTKVIIKAECIVIK